MRPLANGRHEKFAQLCADGSPVPSLSSGRRRRQECRCESGSMDEVFGVKARLAELRGENDRKSTLKREEALQWLADVVRTPVGQIHTDHPLAQSYKVDTDGDLEVRMPDKIAAIALLAKMCGWNEPDRLQISTDSLTTYLLQLRALPIGAGTVSPLEQPELLDGSRRIGG